MTIRVAVHGQSGFASRWMDSGPAKGVEIVRVNGFSSDVLSRIEGCSAFLWHLNHDQYNDLWFARNILSAIETRGIRVFPNRTTASHFDDKIAQKYLLESIGAPLAKTWVFFSKDDAQQFLDDARFPLVFKLRRGAGSMNVRKVETRREAVALINRMFWGGINPFPTGERLKRSVQRAVSGKRHSRSFGQRILNVLRQFIQKALYPNRERGYVLFQHFVPGNDHDIRATVIGNRCFVFHREVRPKDFRASGSGRIVYLDPADIPGDVVDTAFSISKTLQFQSMAYDFVRDPDSHNPVLLEMSYVFNAEAIERCPGYWDIDHHWHPGHVWPQDAILDDLLA